MNKDHFWSPWTHHFVRFWMIEKSNSSVLIIWWINWDFFWLYGYAYCLKSICRNWFEPFRMSKSKIFELTFAVQNYIGKRQYIPAWPMCSRYPIKSICQWRGMMNNNDSLHFTLIIYFVAKVFGPFPVKNIIVDLNMFFFRKWKQES